MRLLDALSNDKRFFGRYRFQEIVRGYIVDFLFPDYKLVVELDGSIHETQQKYDAKRTLHLNHAGYRVTRLQNTEIFKKLPDVLSRIYVQMNSIAYNKIKALVPSLHLPTKAERRRKKQRQGAFKKGNLWDFQPKRQNQKKKNKQRRIHKQYRHFGYVDDFIHIEGVRRSELKQQKLQAKQSRKGLAIVATPSGQPSRSSIAAV